jgi:hypothetical protein
MSAGERWLRWRRDVPTIVTPAIACRVWVPVADLLDIWDERGARAVREALVAILDDAEALARGGDEQSGDRDN